MKLSQTTYKLAIVKKKESVIVKFKCRKLKPRVFFERKNLWNKSEDLRQLKFSAKVYSIWFWNNVVNVKLNERSNPVKNFLSLTLTIWMILLAILHFKCFHLLLRFLFHYMFSPYTSNFL